MHISVPKCPQMIADSPHTHYHPLSTNGDKIEWTTRADGVGDKGLPLKSFYNEVMENSWERKV